MSDKSAQNIGNDKFDMKFWLDNSTNIIAILTAISACAVFLIRGFLYFYKWGYHDALGVDVMYIEVESMGVLYHVVGYIGVFGLIVCSNYATYITWTKSKLRTLLLLLLEVAFFWIILFLSTGISPIDAFIEMIQLGLYRGYGELIFRIILIVFSFNLYGIYLGMGKNSLKKSKQKEIGEGKSTGLEYNKKEMVIVFLIFLIVEGLVTYFTGMGDASSKKDYKAIVETIEKGSVVEDKYTILWNGQTVKVYPILCETKECYVLSYLYKEGEKIDIEINHQREIPKDGVETIYFENIYEIEDNNISNEYQDKSVNDKANTKEKDGMLATLVGVIIGACVGGGVTFFIEERKRKKEQEQVQSHAASILYYDIKSIESYLTEERSSVNIRYSSDWQSMVASCSFLSDEKVKYLYKIYDETYNYKDFYKQKQKKGKKFSKEEIPQYEKLKRMMFDSSSDYIDEKKHICEYEELLNELKEHID